MAKSSGLDTILELLELSQYYPGKLPQANFCQISKQYGPEQNPKTNKDVVRYLVRKIFDLNRQALEQIVLQPMSRIFRVITKVSSLITKQSSNQGTSEALHSLDVLFTIYLCCDHLFRQELATRLWKCHLSVPFMICTDESVNPKLFLWPLRKITITKHRELNQSQFKSIYLAQANIPVASFIRFRSLEVSKSALINAIVGCNPPNECMFFNRACRGHRRSDYIVGGSIDVGCTLPKMTPALCLNLRGHANVFTSSLKTVVCLSEIIVAICHMDETEDIEGLLKLVTTLEGTRQVLIVNTESDPSNEVKEQYKKIMEEHKRENIVFLDCPATSGVPQTKSQRNDILCEHFYKLLQAVTCQTSLEQKVEALKTHSQIVIDECDEMFIGVKTVSSNIAGLLRKYNPEERRAKAFPVQGDEWKNWIAAEDNKRSLSGKAVDEDIVEYTEKCAQKQHECRQKQYQMMQNQPSEAMEIFISHLQEYESLKMCLLLRLLELELDQMSLEAENQLLLEHAKTLEERNQSTGDEREKLTIKLHSIDSNILSAPLRLEHFVREMGQMYEAAVCYTQDFQRQNRNSIYKKCSLLPGIASKMLLGGYVLEIYDGDLGGVAVSWVQQVLKSTLTELQSIVKNRKINVFVVSAVGLQSSGKSTFLNSMFDTHFTVGAGKATRGVHMKIIEVDHDLQKEIEMDFLVVIDTEGLRSPESLAMSSYKRENQILTFVTALSDVTMISLMGEHTGQFDEILPICMHAFLRMKLTHHHPACKLVHQNVNPNDARKLQTQGGILITKLDEAFKAACMIEKISDIEKTYQDVVRFSFPDDVYYIPNLIDGSNTGAHNNIYTENIQFLKSRLLSKNETSSAPRHTLDDFSDRIKQVWEAVVSEDFVFEFKNVTEIFARGKLDETWSAISWDFSKATESYCLLACSEIDTCSEKEQLNQILVKLTEKLRDFIAKESTKRAQELESSFESPQNRYCDVQKQWKRGMLSKFNGLTSDLLKEQKHILQNRCLNHQMKLEVLKRNKIYKERMITFIKNVVTGKSCQPADSKQDRKNEMKAVFESHWMTWVENLSKELSESCKPYDVKVAIPDDALRYLQDQYPSHKVEIERQLHGQVLGQMEDLKNNPSLSSAKDDLQILSRKLAEKMPDLFGNLDNSPKMYISAQMNTAARYIKDCVENISTRMTDTTIEDQICLAISGCNIVVRKLQQRHAAFSQTYNVKTILTNEKTLYFNLFCTIYDKENSLKYFLQEIEKAVRDGIATVVKLVSSVAIADAIKNTSHKHQLASKQHFLFSILIKIATPDHCFEDVLQYIKEPSRVARQVLSGYMKSTEPHLGYIISSLVIDLIDQISTVLDKVTATKAGAPPNLSTWISNFQQESLHVIALPDICYLHAVITENVENCDLTQFNQDMKDLLKKHCKDTCENIMGDVEYLKVAMYEAESQLHRAVVGCEEKCPFCFEMCARTYHNNDDHFTQLHRPQGISGVTITPLLRGPTLVATTCNEDVNSEKKFKVGEADTWVQYKKYKTVERCKNWDIQGSTRSDTSFWCWYYNEYLDKLAETYQSNKPALPNTWKSLQKSVVISTLRKFVFPNDKRIVEATGECFRSLSENAKQEFLKFCDAVRDDQNMV